MEQKAWSLRLQGMKLLLWDLWWKDSRETTFYTMESQVCLVWIRTQPPPTIKRSKNRSSAHHNELFRRDNTSFFLLAQHYCKNNLWSPAGPTSGPTPEGSAVSASTSHGLGAETCEGSTNNLRQQESHVFDFGVCVHGTCPRTAAHVFHHPGDFNRKL